MRQGGATMHNTRSENLDIARRYVNGELTPTEAQKMLGVTRNGIYYWANEYRRSIGETVPTKPRNSAIREEVAGTDELNRLSSLSREQLIDEVIRAKVGEARAKKGYEVKGGGASREYVSLSSKNTK